LAVEAFPCLVPAFLVGEDLVAFPFLAVAAFLDPCLVWEAFLLGWEASFLAGEALLRQVEVACLMALTGEGIQVLEPFQRAVEALLLAVIGWVGLQLNWEGERHHCWVALDPLA